MPILVPCSTPFCPGYAEPTQAICPDCRKRMDACPNCGAGSDLRENVRVRGEKYKVVKTQRLSPTRHCGKSYTRAVPVVYVQKGK